MNTVIIYHANCADGLSAMMLWKTKYPEGTFISMKHSNKVLIEIEAADKIVFLDFVFPNDIMKELASTKEIIVYDHHKSTEESLEDVKYSGIVDMNRCAAKIVYSVVNESEEYPDWLNCVDAQDRWKWDEYPNAKAFMAYIYDHGYVNPERISEVPSVDFEKALYEGGIIASTKTKFARGISRGFTRCKLGEHTVALITDCSRMFASECGNIIVTENEDIVAAVMAKYSPKDKMWWLSFRSAPQNNCLELFKDGPVVPKGHPCACGAETPDISIFQVITEE